MNFSENVEIYKTLKEGDIYEEILRLREIKARRRGFSFYTDYLGMTMFNLAMLGLHINVSRFWLYEPKNKSKYRAIFSLGKKEGLTKAYLNKDNVFEVKVGTCLILKTKDINEEVINRINESIKNETS